MLAKGFSLRAPSRRATMNAVKSLLNLKIIFTALIVLVFIGMAGFHFIEHWSWFDGFYMVLTTISTIGYGEVHPLSHIGRIFNSFVIVAGVGLVLLFFGECDAGSYWNSSYNRFSAGDAWTARSAGCRTTTFCAARDA